MTEMKRAAKAAIRHFYRVIAGERPSRWELRRRMRAHMHRALH